MKIQIIVALMTFCLSPNAKADLSELKSYPVWIAAKQCHALTGFCATKFEVPGDARHQAGGVSCHNVNKAVDIYGSQACLIGWTTCLSGLPTNWVNPVLYCYTYGVGIGRVLNWINEGKCNRAAHTDHLHLQPLFGCRGQGGNED